VNPSGDNDRAAAIPAQDGFRVATADVACLTLPGSEDHRRCRLSLVAPGQIARSNTLRVSPSTSASPGSTARTCRISTSDCRCTPCPSGAKLEARPARRIHAVYGAKPPIIIVGLRRALDLALRRGLRALAGPRAEDVLLDLPGRGLRQGSTAHPTVPAGPPAGPRAWSTPTATPTSSRRAPAISSQSRPSSA
jgi:hypothetical protein